MLTAEQVDLWVYLAQEQREYRAKQQANETVRALLPIFEAMFGGG